MIWTLNLVALLHVLVISSVGAQYLDRHAVCTSPNRETGICTGIRECPALLNILRMRPLSREALEFLRQSQCGFEGNNPLVCCATNNPSVPTRPTSQDTVYDRESTTMSPGIHDGMSSDDSNLQYDFSNNPLLPNNECGKDLSQRIFGGERTELDEFPWMALLEYRKPYGMATACGGVLISRRYILTAAHCVQGKDLPKTWHLESVRLGEYNTATDQDCIQDGDETVICADDPISVGVEEQIVHENYQPLARDQKYDIALLRLNRDVQFTNFIKPICLPKNSSLGQKLYVAGWGKTENGTSSNIKLKLSLPPVNKEQCDQVYNKASVRLGYGQLCAGGQKGKDSCRGDSGGPLMALERAFDGTGRWTTVGVVSFGPSPCGMVGWPGVYTRVIDFVPWMINKMRA